MCFCFIFFTHSFVCFLCIFFHVWHVFIRDLFTWPTGKALNMIVSSARSWGLDRTARGRSVMNRSTLQQMPKQNNRINSPNYLIPFYCFVSGIFVDCFDSWCEENIWYHLFKRKLSLCFVSEQCVHFTLVIVTSIAISFY